MPKITPICKPLFQQIYQCLDEMDEAIDRLIVMNNVEQWAGQEEDQA